METTPTVDESDSIVEIRTTFGNRAAAEACADRLVTARMAACVQIEGPVSSVYRWRGAVDRSQEFRCVCKTAPHLADACVEAIRRHHDYETPELIRTTVMASTDYAAWVRAAVADA